MSATPHPRYLREQIERLDLRSAVAAELCTEAILLGDGDLARWHADRYAARDALRVEYRQQMRDLARMAVTA